MHSASRKAGVISEKLRLSGEGGTRGQPELDNLKGKTTTQAC